MGSDRSATWGGRPNPACMTLMWPSNISNNRADLVSPEVFLMGVAVAFIRATPSAMDSGSLNFDCPSGPTVAASCQGISLEPCSSVAMTLPTRNAGSLTRGSSRGTPLANRCPCPRQLLVPLVLVVDLHPDVQLLPGDRHGVLGAAVQSVLESHGRVLGPAVQKLTPGRGAELL